MVVIDDEVRFDPFAEITGFASELNRGNSITGTVVYVNYANKWFLVEYGEAKTKISFKFSDIGKAVKVCGRR